MNDPKTMSEDDWKAELSDEQYKVLRGKATEHPFTGELLDNKDSGMYVCAGCGIDLFSSETKYDSGSGWPSFWEASSPDSVELIDDSTFGMKRTEVVCKNCGGHLGHVFSDGPSDKSGDRFCINSASLGFAKKDEEDSK